MLVSVVIPVYNRRDLVQETVASVLGQTYPDREVIVVDDGSTDGTPQRLRESFGSSITVVEAPHAGLPAAGRNRGIDHARGELIAFCDSDDLWLPGKLERQVERLAETGADLTCADAYILGSPGQRHLSHYRFRWSTPLRNLLWANFVMTSTVVVRRSALKAHRFDEGLVWRGYEDYVLWLSLARHGFVIDYLDEPLIRYRADGDRLTPDVSRRDVRVKLRLLLQEPSYWHHPGLLTLKLAQLAKLTITTRARGRSEPA